MPSTNFDITAFVGLDESVLLEFQLAAIAAIKAGNGSVPGALSGVSTPPMSVNYYQGWSPIEVLAAAKYAIKSLEKKNIKRINATFT